MQDFEEIYVRYLKDVYRFLLKLCGNHDIADELTQSTFTIAFEKLDGFRGTCSISVWLCQIAKHEYYAYYRKHRHLVREEEALNYAQMDSMEEAIIDRAQQAQIQKILNGLPEPYKEVFTLRVMAEFSFRDISKAFGRSESWARVTYYRAKCMITERLGGDGDD